MVFHFATADQAHQGLKIITGGSAFGPKKWRPAEHVSCYQATDASESIFRDKDGQSLIFDQNYVRVIAGTNKGKTLKMQDLYDGPDVKPKNPTVPKLFFEGLFGKIHDKSDDKRSVVQQLFDGQNCQTSEDKCRAEIGGELEFIAWKGNAAGGAWHVYHASLERAGDIELKGLHDMGSFQSIVDAKDKEAPAYKARLADIKAMNNAPAGSSREQLLHKVIGDMQKTSKLNARDEIAQDKGFQKETKRIAQDKGLQKETERIAQEEACKTAANSIWKDLETETKRIEQEEACKTAADQITRDAETERIAQNGASKERQ